MREAGDKLEGERRAKVAARRAREAAIAKISMELCSPSISEVADFCREEGKGNGENGPMGLTKPITLLTIRAIWCGLIKIKSNNNIKLKSFILNKEYIESIKLIIENIILEY